MIARTAVLATALTASTAALRAGLAQDLVLGPPRLTAPAPIADAPEGHFLVTWEPPPGAAPGLEFEVAYAPTREFADATTSDVGDDRASFLSGLPAGTTYVRVRAFRQGEAGAWSTAGSIVVEYPNASTVRRLMILGGVTGILLLIAVLLGHFRTYSATSAVGGP